MITPIPAEIEEQLPAVGSRCRSQQQLWALRVAVTAGWAVAVDVKNKPLHKNDNKAWDGGVLDVYRSAVEENPAESTLAAAGFAAPSERWSKPDPRGEEYGTYYACGLANHAVRVSYEGADSSENWSAVIPNATEFTAWAKANT